MIVTNLCVFELVYGQGLVLKRLHEGDGFCEAISKAGVPLLIAVGRTVLCKQEG